MIGALAGAWNRQSGGRPHVAEHTPAPFLGKEVLRSYHMTRVPIPPGLGVFFHKSRGRLHAYLSYAEGLLREDEVNEILCDLRSRLEG